MKNIISISMFLFISLHCFSQQKAIFEFRDGAGKIVKQEKKASSFTRIRNLNDTCWRFDNYTMKGPMVFSREYKDKEGHLLHGRSSFMRPDGSLDSTGLFVNGKPNGAWLYFDDKGTRTMKKEYSMGEILSTADVINKNAGEKDIATDHPDVEAQFPGSTNGWNKYLLPNLKYPVYAMENGIQGEVKVYFQVDTEGLPQEELLLKSAGFTIDDEALRIVRESPKWIPATKDGQKVRSYKQQSVMFRIQR